MLLREPSPDAVAAGTAPRISRLGLGFYAAAFSVIKLLPAHFIIQHAIDRGEVRPGTTVAESTSGSFGLGLALVCRLRGIPLTLIGDTAIDAPLRRRLADLGARVTIVTARDARKHPGGVQGARLDRLARLRERNPDTFWPRQYHNPLNPASYGFVAERILETIGAVDALICPVGSGGSSCGIGSFLRTVAPQTRLIGVDTPGSVLFGAPPGPRMVRGLGNGILPQVLDHRLFDEVHWIDAPTAFAATRMLHVEHGLFMGPTSGAAHLVAKWWHASNPGSVAVVILPDEGHRYQNTVFNEQWLKRKGVLSAGVPAAPGNIGHPSEVAAGWTRFAWGRRSLDEVMAASAGSMPPREALGAVP